MARSAAEDGPDPIDVHVGRRVRQRRKARGVTQEQLAEALQLTFQQVQKYERGANRVSASKLYAIATHLQTPIEWFFEGLRRPEGDAPFVESPHVQAIEAFMGTAEGIELAEAVPLLPQRLRRKILDLVTAMAIDAQGGLE